MILPSNVQAHKPNEQLMRGLRESIVLVTSATNVTLTTKETNVKKTKDDSAYGTGVIIEHRGKVSFVLTAAHVCDVVYFGQIKNLFPEADPELHDVETESIAKLTDIEGNEQPALIFGISPRYDVCILITKRMNRKAMKFSGRTARLAEKVYSMGFPGLSQEIGVVPLFEGYYAGTDMTGRAPRDIYTIPTTGGTSGSPVFTEEGKIVGIATTGNRRFESWNGCVTHEQLVSFYIHFMDMFSEHEEKIVEMFMIEMEKIQKMKEELLLTPDIPDAVLPPVPGFE